MGGILKNKSDKETASVAQSTKEFREQVLKNTKLNAQLTSEHHQTSDLPHHLSEEDMEKLQWNKKNLEDNEAIQQKILENMETTIDEPKTPFQHATEMNEYYKDDDDLEAFSLGEPELKEDEVSVLDKETVESEEYEEPKPKPQMSFEEMKKMHYHHEAPQFHPVEDEDDEDDEEEESKPKMSFAEMRKMHYSKEHVTGESVDGE
jgi:protein phosphatase inhibitor 2